MSRDDDYKHTFSSWKQAAQTGLRVYKIGKGKYRVTAFGLKDGYDRAGEKSKVLRLLKRLGVG